MGAGDLLMQSINGVYFAMWSQHYPVEFISPELLSEGKGDHYKLLLMPFLMLVTPLCAQAVKRYVEHGGSVVAFAKCGMLDDRSWYWHDRPGGFTDLFGVKEARIERREAIELIPNPSHPLSQAIHDPICGYWHQQELTLLKEVDILATYPDGKVAGTLNRFGKGKAILLGTHLDAAAVDMHTPGVHRFFANLASFAGVLPPLDLQASPLVDGHLLVYQGQRLIILLNYGHQAEIAVIKVPATLANQTVQDLFSGEQLPTRQDGGSLCIEITLDGLGSTAIILEGGQ
jgi:beta-galactosidase